MFPRARLKRFNEASENTPGVGSYNVAANKSETERNRSLSKLNQTSIHLRDKGLVANARGELPKHVEELHKRLRVSEEKVIDLDILKISADKEREMLQNEIGSLRGRVSSMIKDYEALMVAEEDSREACKMLEEEKAHLLECLDVQMPELHSLIEELRDQVNLFKGLCGHRENLVRDLETQMSTMEQRLNNLAAEKLALSKELQVSRACMDDLQQSHDKLSNDNSTILIEVTTLQDSLNVAKRSCKEYEDKLEVLEKLQSDKLHDYEQKIEFLNSERSMLQIKIAEILKQTEAELMLKSTTCEELTAQKFALMESLNILRQENIKLQEYMKKVTEVQSQNGGQVQKLEEALKLLKKQINTVISEMYAKTLAWEESKAQKASIEEQLSSSKNEVKCLQEELQRAQNDLMSIQKLNNEKMKEVERQEKHSCEQEKAMVEIRGNIEALKSELQLKSKACEDAMAKKFSLEKSADLLQRDNFHLEDKLKRVAEELITCQSQNRDQLQNLEVEMEFQKEQLNTVKNEMNMKTVALEECKEQKASLEEQLRSSRNDLACLQEELKRAQNDVISLNELHNERMKEVVERQEKYVCEQEQVLTEMRKNSDTTKSELQLKSKACEDVMAQKLELEKSVDLLQQEKIQLEDKLRRVAGEMITFQSQNSDQVQNLEEKIRLQQEQLDTVKTEMYVKTVALEESQGQRASLEEQLRSSRNDHVCLQEELKRVQTDLMSIQELHNEKMQDMEKQEKCCNDQEQAMMEMQKNFEAVKSELQSKSEAYEDILAQKLELEKSADLLQQAKIQLEEKLIRAQDDLICLDEQHSETLQKREEEEEYRQEQYATMMEEMSEKIKELEECQANVSHDSEGEQENWREKFEDLQLRMEPFKEIIEAFEIEKKLIEDRDKYTQEQIDKLQQEAIKNMGHQNHKQKVKYVNTLKQENINLQQKCREKEEELVRQTVLVKKYKQRIDLLEAGKNVSTKTPSKSRAPLKEGNR